jgi:glycosyltransferase involved in cell wall biosynthesis
LQSLANARVEFKGKVSDKELDKLYKSCDVVLFPVLAEPFGLVPIEAMKRGKPIICSREAGVAEIVEKANAGIIVNPLDIKQIADAILLLKEKPAMRKKLGNAGRRFVKGLETKCLVEFEHALKETVREQKFI